MKISFVAKAALIAASLPLLAGCVERQVVYRSAPGEVVVSDAPAPPPPPTEVVVAAPGPEAYWYWVPGTWEWRGRWIWTGGHWVHRPRPNAVWVTPHWGMRGHARVWVGGYWR